VPPCCVVLCVQLAGPDGLLRVWDVNLTFGQDLGASEARAQLKVGAINALREEASINPNARISWVLMADDSNGLVSGGKGLSCWWCGSKIFKEPYYSGSDAKMGVYLTAPMLACVKVPTGSRPQAANSCPTYLPAGWKKPGTVSTAPQLYEPQTFNTASGGSSGSGGSAGSARGRGASQG